MGFVPSPLLKLFCLHVPGFRITSCRQDSLLMRYRVVLLLHCLVGFGS